AAEELTGRRAAVALIGGYADSLVGPVSEVADRARLPYLATASLDERLTERGNRYFFRISSLASYVRVTTGMVRDLLKADIVAILYSHTPGASQLARRQKDTLERAGIRISVFEPFAPGLSDFTPLLARVRDTGAQVLLSDTFFGDHLLLVRQMAQTGDAARDALAAVDIETPLGRVKFDDKGEPLFYERVIVQIQQGRHVVVYPRARAAAPAAPR